jgi:thiamine-monophosphate kinase
MLALADAESIELVGGDTTRGPLSITITVMGEVPTGLALRRHGAQVGDDVWVSGELGGAALALDHLQGRVCLAPNAFEGVEPRLHEPQPRVALGLALRGIASAAIDISDGVIADLGHICERSKLRATIQWEQMPEPRPLAAQDVSRRMRCALAGGDDYELCFSAAPSAREEIAILSAALHLPLTRIGALSMGLPGVEVRDGAGKVMAAPSVGFDHFAAQSVAGHGT